MHTHARASRLLRFEDRVRDHPRFVAAAKGAVAVSAVSRFFLWRRSLLTTVPLPLAHQIYCRMHDDPAAFGAAPVAPFANGDDKLGEAPEGQQENGEEKALSRKDKKKAKGKAKKGALAALVSRFVPARCDR